MYVLLQQHIHILKKGTSVATEIPPESSYKAYIEVKTTQTRLLAATTEVAGTTASAVRTIVAHRRLLSNGAIRSTR